MSKIVENWLGPAPTDAQRLARKAQQLEARRAMRFDFHVPAPLVLPVVLGLAGCLIAVLELLYA